MPLVGINKRDFLLFSNVSKNTSNLRGALNLRVVELWFFGGKAIAKMMGCDITLREVRNKGERVVIESNASGLFCPREKGKRGNEQ